MDKETNYVEETTEATSDTRKKNKSKKEREMEKRQAEMKRRREEEEARKRALAAKKKKRIIILVAALCVVVIVAIAVGVPLGLRNANEYKPLNFKSLDIPDTSAEARAMAALYNGQKYTMEGYMYPCGEAMVLCKEVVTSCPYVVGGAIPTNGILLTKRNGLFSVDQQYVNARVSGTVIISSTSPQNVAGQDTYMYMTVDKIEVLD